MQGTCRKVMTIPGPLEMATQFKYVVDYHAMIVNTKRPNLLIKRFSRGLKKYCCYEYHICRPYYT